MIGLKRYIRPGIAVSVIGPLAILIVGLSFVGASAFSRFRHAVTGQRQRPGTPITTAATAPSAAAIATASHSAARGQGGPCAAPTGAGSDARRASPRRQDRTRKAESIVRAAACCNAADGTDAGAT